MASRDAGSAQHREPEPPDARVDPRPGLPDGGPAAASHGDGERHPGDYSGPMPHVALDPAFGGPLVISRPGQVFVATDALLAHLDRLRTVGDELRRDAAGVDALARDAHALGSASPSVRRTSHELDVTRAAIASAAETTEQLRADLSLAVTRYSEAERDLSARQQQLAAWLGMLAGALLRPLLLLLVPSGLVGYLAYRQLPGSDQQKLRVLQQWFLQHPEILTSPDFVAAVRAIVGSMDDAIGTFAGLPPDVVAALGDEGLGVFGVDTSARFVLLAGGLAGALRETEVRVQRTGTSVLASGPVGVGERLDRVPEGDQVRIERYDAPGLPPRYLIYVGPTETFSPIADTEPWDLTSNIAGVAGLPAGSFRATELAMRDAGITASDQVDFVGFSQGGLIATMLAASGDWNSAGLETHGAPAGGIALPPGLDGMAIRNTDDFIPALGGPQRDTDLLQVERRAFAEGSPMPTYHAAPAHQRDAYNATAQAVDAARSPEVREQIGAMDAFTGDYTRLDGSTITEFRYHAERIPAQHGAPVDPRATAEVGRAATRISAG